MMKLLSIELKKIVAYPIFWVFTGLYALMIILVFCIIPSIHLPGPPGLIGIKSYYTFPDIWHTLTYTAGFFNLLLGVLVVILITNEFTYRTVRQNIIDGWSVFQFIVAKIILIVFLALCTTFFVFLLGIVYGLIASPSVDATTIFSEFSFVVAYFFQALAYLCFALFMGTLFKKAGIGIVLFLLYSKIVEPLIGWRLPKAISDYLPFHNISSLIDNPAFKLVGISVQNSSPLDIHFLFTIIYSCIFLIATYLLFIRRDN
jgi:ABC-2 type transport system permease protein